MLAVAFMEEKRIRFYDSMDYTKLQSKSPYKKYVGWILMYLKEEHRRKHGTDLEGWQDGEHVPTPMQDNGDDCGVFVCTFAEHIMFDRPMEFSQDDITRGARNHIALTLINERQPIELD